MQKNTLYIAVGVVLLVLVGGYLGRQQIRTLFGTGTTQPATTSTMYSATPTAPTTPTAAPSDNIYMTKTNSTKGDYLTDFNGMTLYIFDKDSPGKSTCYNACATAWPPYTSGAAAQSTLPANIILVTRTDGSMQFAWKGWPLYYYANDQKAGDLTGDGVGGVWHIVKP